MSLSAALTAVLCLAAACEAPPDEAPGAAAAAPSETSALRATTTGAPVIGDEPATATRPTRTDETRPLPPVTPPTPARPLPVDPLPPILVVPIDPPPPPPHKVCGNTVRISSNQLDSALKLLLLDTKISYDTTGTSPPLTGQVYGCSYPNHQALEAAIAECHALPKSAWASCDREAKATFPDDPVCGTHPAQFHSYVDFGPFAESKGAEDQLFDTNTIVKDTSTGEATFDINFVHTTVNLDTLASSFTNDLATGRANARLSLSLFSNDPTIPCTYWTGCPDLELSDMRVDATLVGIAPTADKLQLGFDHSDVTFNFEKNFNNVPDWVIDLFVDVESIIKSRVKNTLQNGLNKEKTRVAVNKAITGLAKAFASDEIGFFYDAWFENSSLVVDYQPASSPLAAGIGCVSSYAAQ